MAIYNVNKDTGDITETAGKYGSSNSVFYGTIAQWNALTTAEKKAYDHASIPDSIDGGVTFPANKVIMTGGGNVENAIITLHGYTDISASVLDLSSFTATDNCILLLNSNGTDNARPYFNYLVNSTQYGTAGVLNASLDRYVFLRKGDVFKFNDTYPYENTLTNYVYLV